MKVEKSCGVTGRPRNFCVEDALDKALRVFWQKGYDGASLSDLTEAMGINRPSLYAAYGNKENLFLKALDRYGAVYSAFVPKAMEEPTALRVVEALLKGAAESMSDPCKPKGCLGVQGALSCSESAEFARNELAARRNKVQEMLASRFMRAKEEGDLRDDADPEALAFFVATVIQGMSVQATGNATRAELDRAIDIALNAFKIETNLS